MEIEMENQNMDILGNLPPELVQEICKFLTDKSINNALRCCKRWNYLIDYNYFWFGKCKLNGFKAVEKSFRSEFYENYVNKFSSPWKGIYIYHSLAENWRNNNFKSVVVNATSVFKIHHFDDEVLIATTNFNELIVVDSSTGWQQFYYQAIYGGIHSVARHENWVIFLEERLLCWQKFGEEGHLYYIALNISSSWDLMTSIEMYSNLAAVLDQRTGLSIVHLTTLELLYANENARCICFDDDVAAVGTNEGTIEMLNLQFQKMGTLAYNYNVTFWKTMMKGDYLISFHGENGSGHDYIVSVWNLKQEICLYSLKERVYATPGVTILSQALFFSLERKINRDTHKIVCLDLNSGNYLLKIDSEETNLRTIATNGHHLFTVSHLIVKVWSIEEKNLIMVINDVNPFFLLTFKVTETKMAQIKRNGNLELRNYDVNY